MSLQDLYSAFIKFYPAIVQRSSKT